MMNVYSGLMEVLSKEYHIPETEFGEVMRLFYVLKQKKGERFVSEGEIPSAMAFVVNGLYKYYFVDHTGNECIKHFAKENDFIASYASFIEQKPSNYCIEAMEPTELLVIKHKDYIRMIEQNFNWQSVARKYAEHMYILKETRETSLLKDYAPERYLNFMRDNPDIIGRIKQKDIASYLGIAPESLSRLKLNDSEI